jgi:hypothetical protein
MLFLAGVVVLLCTVPATAVAGSLHAPWWMVLCVFAVPLAVGFLLMIIDVRRTPPPLPRRRA